ncbi:MAG: PAS domain-containing protein [Chloroflexi bacterium]|nr:PAS domain-containing protein [Chloroflexota bacterium]
MGSGVLAFIPRFAQRAGLPEAYARIFDLMTDGALVTDPDGTVIAVNPALQTAFGQAGDALIGRSATELIPDLHQDLPETCPVRIATRLYAVRHDTLTDRKGQVAGAVLVFVDITEKEDPTRLGELLYAETERHYHLTEVIRATVHQIRTPLSVIGTSLYVYHRTHDAEKRANSLKNVEKQAEHIERALDGLGALARLDEAFEPHPDTVDLTDLVIKAAAAAQQRTHTATHNVVFELQADLPTIIADELALKRAIGHLVENAILYSPDGGTVTICTHLNGELVIEVRDTGIGIPADELPQIFEHHFRGAYARQHNPGGVGLGLMQVRRIAELHGGHAEAENLPTGGTAFRMRLPYREYTPLTTDVPLPH